MTDHNAETVERVAKAINGPREVTHIGVDKLRELQDYRWENQTTPQERIDKLSAARAALSALPSPAPVSGWQPIESAPRDGSSVDLLCIRRHCHGVADYVRKCDCTWGDIADQFSGVVFQGWRGIGETYAENTPTHWMSAPLLPALTTTKESDDA